MQDAPLLGSLLDPWRHLKNDLAMSDFGGLQQLLTEALTTERPQLWNEAVGTVGCCGQCPRLADRRPVAGAALSSGDYQRALSGSGQAIGSAQGCSARRTTDERRTISPMCFWSAVWN
jgi:hypothetical protein